VRIVKVANVAQSDLAGVSGQMLRSGAALQRLGHDVSYVWAADFPLSRLPERYGRLISPLLLGLKLALGHRDADVLEIHEPQAFGYGTIRRLLSTLPPLVLMSHGLHDTAMRAEKPYVHAPSLPRRAWIRIGHRQPSLLGIRLADHIIVLNDDDRDYLTQSLEVPPERVTVAPNGGAADGTPPEAFRVPSPQLRCLFLGQWIPRKGVRELSEACRLLESRADVTVTLAGVGSAEVDGATTIPSYTRDALPPLLSRHDVLVMPSWYEGAPLAAVEAMAAGLALVATPCGNLRTFEEQGAAIVVPFSDPPALATAIERLADDRPLLARLQGCALEVGRRFTWECTARNQEAAYAAAVARRKRRQNRRAGVGRRTGGPPTG
jgi:glycosyltransferase involved in cell wall biosynthesis